MHTIGARLRNWTPLLLLCSSTALAQAANETAVVETTTHDVAAASIPSVTSSTTTTSLLKAPALSSTESTCAFRTINYITHTLPQQCLRTSWTAPTVAAAIEIADGGVTSPIPWAGVPWVKEGTVEDASDNKSGVLPEATGPPEQPAASGTVIPDAEGELETDSPLDNANFLSFEEWKVKNLARAGQSPENVGQGRAAPSDQASRRRPVNINALDSLGDEAEIELDFGGFGDPDGKDTTASASTDTQSGGQVTEVTDEDGKAAPTTFALGKDAGKTCKERFNYASFDCAATVLKTNNKAKSSSAVLVENKDSYMLNECSAQNKFVIVELCDDILVDTVVLANYEFFSSMFRHFRISVSDRYPVKMDRWRDLGTFEARNSRDIQPFLITEPQIWARYLRIEFLTHYGNEFYCPISLIRVHGTTMMEQFRREEEEARGDVDYDEPIEAAEGGPVETAAALTEGVRDIAPGETPPLDKSSESHQHAPAEPESQTRKASPDSKTSASETSSSAADGPSTPVVSQPPKNATLGLNETGKRSPQSSQANTVSASTQSVVNEVSDAADDGTHTKSETASSSTVPSSPASAEEKSVTATESGPPSGNSASDPPNNQSTTTSSTVPSAKTASNSTNNGSLTQQRGSHTQPNAATPTTQESFFKSIHKRLQQLEANSTLSLQYIEEQSRILRDAFIKVEKRQLAKTEKFLDHLNNTVIQELKSYRGMYDQLWQSTILELEGMKERQRAEIGEIGARLSLVADELVWQKRMAVVQSTLLLLCLGLVLFVRSGTMGSQSEVPIVQQLGSKYSQFFDSPPRSPENSGVVRRRRTFKNMWRSDTSALSAGSGHLSDGVTAVSDADTDGRRSPLRVGFSPPTPNLATPDVEYGEGMSSGLESSPAQAVGPVPVGKESESGLSTPRSLHNDLSSDECEDTDLRVEVLATQSGPATPRGSRDIRPSWEEVDRAVETLKAEQQGPDAAAAIGQERRQKRSLLSRSQSYNGNGDGARDGSPDDDPRDDDEEVLLAMD